MYDLIYADEKIAGTKTVRLYALSYTDHSGFLISYSRQDSVVQSPLNTEITISIRSGEMTITVNGSTKKYNVLKDGNYSNIIKSLFNMYRVNDDFDSNDILKHIEPLNGIASNVVPLDQPAPVPPSIGQSGGNKTVSNKTVSNKTVSSKTKKSTKKHSKKTRY
jgi:hypothetical protein